MTKLFLFSGQGAQSVGMGRDAAEQIAIARDTFAEADQALGIQLSDVCFNGPAEELNRTDIAQPALLCLSIALLRAVEHALGRQVLQKNDLAAGLSLGEYTALVATGALDFATGLQLVRARGKYMQEACDAAPSGMTSVIGLDLDKVEMLLNTCREGDVLVAANINAPGQIAVSGSIPALERVEARAKETGARMAVRLQVAGAFHSPLMEPARERLAKEIEKADFKTPCCGVIANVTGAVYANEQEMRATLLQQLTSPVQWIRSMETAIAAGVTEAIEFGAGNVLCGLLKRIDRSVASMAVGDAAGVENVVERLG